MKVGDLVRHPQGMAKYREEQYGLGVVLKIHRPRTKHPHRMHLQCLVLWRTGEQRPHPAAQLEVINESR